MQNDLEKQIAILQDKVNFLLCRQDKLVRFLYDYFYCNGNFVSYDDFMILRDLLVD